ncbi:MAG: PP0621 family protein [Pseudomonadota bacterium]
MPRLILLVLLVGAGWWLVQSLRRQLGQSDREPPNQGGEGKPPQGEKLVACEECGLHLPLGEATRLQQPGPDGDEVRYFCGREHQLNWQRHHD